MACKSLQSGDASCVSFDAQPNISFPYSP
jgi:hypothetical protein